MIRTSLWVGALLLGATSLAIGAAGQSFPPGGVVTKSVGPTRTVNLSGLAECDEEAVIRQGKVLIPVGATEVSGETLVDEDRGPLSALYPGADTSTDGLYPLPCDPSIGGDIPPAALVPPSPAEVAASAFVTAFENSPGTQGLIERLGAIGGKLPKDLSQLPPFAIGPCKIGLAAPHVVACDDPAFLTSGQPFEGRDIIYVHGLATEHLKRRLANYAPAKKKWPGDQSEFLTTGGYFRMYARDYWRGHITENLFKPGATTSPGAGYEWTNSQAGPTYKPKGNRYMLVSWSSNQTMEYAQHALLTQIMLAMTQNLNVVTPMSYPPQFRYKPFCANGCVIISHSTGSEITSSAMARAARGDFGASARLIPPLVRAHVSFEGAVSGSRLASVGMAISAAGAPSGPAGSILCAVEDSLFETSNTCSLGTAFVAQSILRDLMPPVAQGVWGPLIAQSPVPTVTIAGGHPMGNYPAGVTKLLVPGVDDGVVSMNSACGNPLPVHPAALAPSGATMTSNLKAFDLGIPVARAVKNFLSQKDFQAGFPGARYFAGTCTPYLSTTGMVMPVDDPMSQTMHDSRRRYPNHFSFLQGAMDHAHDGGGDPTNQWPSLTGQSAGTARLYRPAFGDNAEEMSAITDGGIYARAADGTYLVHPSFSNEMHEYVRGKKITFKLFNKKRTWWIWKRTYHLLHHWEQKSSTHFAYEFVGRR